MDRSVREDLAAARRQESGEEEDDDPPEDPQPGLRRDVHVFGAVRANPADVARRLRHGLRPHRTERQDRPDRPRLEERTHGGETLERDVRQEPPAGGALAHVEGFRLRGGRRHRARPEVVCLFFIGSPVLDAPNRLGERERGRFDDLCAHARSRTFRTLLPVGKICSVSCLVLWMAVIEGRFIF